MSIFDGPVSRCEAMRVMVLTDQTQRQCACENGCRAGSECALADVFSGVEVPPGKLLRPAGEARHELDA